MSEKQLKFLEFVPLILFLTFVRSVGTTIEGPQWKISFAIGGAIALFAIAVLLRKKFILNRITLGINLFLISGAIAVLFRIEQLLNLYWYFNPAPMFVWIIAVGLAATLFSSNGFVVAGKKKKKIVRIYSIFLLAAAFGALGISLLFQEAAVFSDVLPVIALFVINDRLQSRLGKRQN